MIRVGVLGGVLLAVLGLEAPGGPVVPAPRYELGWRLRRLERVWAETGEAEHRRVTPRIQDAVSSFFMLRLDSAARGLDLAHAELLGVAEDDPATGVWAAAWAVTPERGLLDAETTVLLHPHRVWEAGVPTGATLAVVDPHRADAVLLTVALAPAVEPPRLQLPDLGERNEPFALVFRVDGCEVLRRPLFLPRIPGVEKALDDLGSQADRAPESLAGLSARHLHRMLERLRAGPPRETDLPVARLLLEARAALETDRAFALRGQHWLAVPVGRAAVPVRIQVPAPSVAPPPVVVALHGAGGSENLFFDGYGNGEIAALCAARGWVLIAPRLGLLGRVDVPALLASMGDLVPFDRRRIFLVGHSMGAAAALGSLRSGFRPAGVVALGGGGQPGSARRLGSTAFLVVAGEFDFGRSGALRLYRTLEDAGHPDATWLEVAATDHLFVVQDALSAVFEWLDRVARAAASGD